MLSTDRCTKCPIRLVAGIKVTSKLASHFSHTRKYFLIRCDNSYATLWNIKHLQKGNKVTILQLWPETKNTGSLYTKMSPGLQNRKPLGEEGFLPSTQRRAKLRLFQRMSLSPPNPTPQHRSPDLIKTQIIKMQSRPTSKPSIQKSTFQQGELRPWMVVMKADQL